MARPALGGGAQPVERIGALEKDAAHVVDRVVRLLLSLRRHLRAVDRGDQLLRQVTTRLCPRLAIALGCRPHRRLVRVVHLRLAGERMALPWHRGGGLPCAATHFAARELTRDQNRRSYFRKYSSKTSQMRPPLLPALPLRADSMVLSGYPIRLISSDDTQVAPKLPRQGQQRRELSPKSKVVSTHAKRRPRHGAACRSRRGGRPGSAAGRGAGRRRWAAGRGRSRRRRRSGSGWSCCC